MLREDLGLAVRCRLQRICMMKADQSDAHRNAILTCSSQVIPAISIDVSGLQMDFPTLPGSHRILNVHQNVPGVLKNVNNIIADLNVNIKAQVCTLTPIL